MDKLHRNIAKKTSQHRQQQHITRLKDKQMLTAIAKDTDKLGFHCKCLSLLGDNQIEKLIDHWQEKGNSKRTIYTKLRLLKKYFNLKIITYFVEKYSLLATEDSNVSRLITWPWISSDNIDDPLVRNIAIAQQLFGLKYREAITLRRSMLLYGNVRILRKYAFNGKDRFILIESEQQKNWVIEFQKQWEQPLDNISNQQLINRVKDNYKLIALPNLDYFRYQYAKTRYQYLRNSIIKRNVERHTLRQLRSELGLSHNGQVRQMLLCLKEC